VLNPIRCIRMATARCVATKLVQLKGWQVDAITDVSHNATMPLVAVDLQTTRKVICVGD
jgi:hypothetical protein